MSQHQKLSFPVFEEKGKFKVWYDSEKGIICGKYWGSMEEKEAKKIAKAYFFIAERLPEPLAAFNDMREAGSASLRARKYFIDLMRYKKLTKIAFWGGGQFNQAFISFILTVARVKKVKYFVSRSEALTWLKKK